MSSGHSSSFLAQLLASREFSDLTFFCCGQEFKVHKVIVCMQSAPIKAAVQGGFEETETNRINMDKFQPDTVRRLVQFMYSGNYDDPGDSDDDHGTLCADSIPSAPSVEAMLLGHIGVNSIGDYYQVDGLMSLANSKIKKLLSDRNANNHESLIAGLPAAIEAAAESTGNKELFEILAEAASRNTSCLLLDTEVLKNLSAMSDFAVSLLQAMINRNLALGTELVDTRFRLCQAEERLQERERTLRNAE
ncbi:hypothetical protein N658DRAFT_499150 [Parathielavia hyrcaniae]|uniref:BTB domain-containing protein n=1 Tax=Parathielavia hyrcaniae TaxID=113614 RepID=A0AAN6SZG6_9PEZI|nr:hypothetical protein N658DRAFT_499150 [Parathielavia hyrcaniae]